MTKDKLEQLALMYNVDLAMGDPIDAMVAVQDNAIRIVIDMANRYDEDIEGCGGDELSRYDEAITYCYRLAYIIKYGHFPPESGAWQDEFVRLSKQLYKGESNAKTTV